MLCAWRARVELHRNVRMCAHKDCQKTRRQARACWNRSQASILSGQPRPTQAPDGLARCTCSSVQHASGMAAPWRKELPQHHCCSGGCCRGVGREGTCGVKLRAEGVTKNPFSNGFEARECAVHVQNGYSNGTVPSSILFPHCCSVQVLHLTSKSLYRTKSRTQALWGFGCQ